MIHNQIVERLSYLKQKATGKTVLHLGAVDPINREKRLKEGNWIHSELCKTAKKVIGVDLLESPLPGYDIRIGNVEEPLVIPEKIDIIIAGEIIEHLHNVGNFLSSLALRFPGVELVITTPNSFSMRKYIGALIGKENIHQDHTLWFSPKTIQSMLKAHGYLSSVFFYAWLGKGIGGKLQKLFYKIFPYLSDGLIVECKYEKIN